MQNTSVGGGWGVGGGGVRCQQMSLWQPYHRPIVVCWGIIMGYIIRHAVYVKEVLLVYAGATVNSAPPRFQHTALQKAWLLHPWHWLSDRSWVPFAVFIGVSAFSDETSDSCQNVGRISHFDGATRVWIRRRSLSSQMKAELTCCIMAPYRLNKDVFYINNLRMQRCPYPNLIYGEVKMWLIYFSTEV